MAVFADTENKHWRARQMISVYAFKIIHFKTFSILSVLKMEDDAPMNLCNEQFEEIEDSPIDDNDNESFCKLLYMLCN